MWLFGEYMVEFEVLTGAPLRVKKAMQGRGSAYPFGVSGSQSKTLSGLEEARVRCKPGVEHGGFTYEDDRGITKNRGCTLMKGVAYPGWRRLMATCCWGLNGAMTRHGGLILRRQRRARGIRDTLSSQTMQIETSL